MKRRIRDMHHRFSTFWWGDTGLSMILVILVLVLLLGPFLDSMEGRVLSSIFLSLLMFTGVTQISSRRLARIGAILVASLAVVLIWLREAYPDDRLLRAGSALATLGFLVVLTLVIIGHTFKEGPVTSSRIQGALAAYLLIGITWANLYRITLLFLPGAFHVPATPEGQASPSTEWQLTYFSFVTLTTVGYGDFVPVHPTARMLAILEALIGQLFPATLLARLVSLQILDRDRDRGE